MLRTHIKGAEGGLTHLVGTQSIRQEREVATQATALVPTRDDLRSFARYCADAPSSYAFRCCRLLRPQTPASLHTLSTLRTVQPRGSLVQQRHLLRAGSLVDSLSSYSPVWMSDIFCFGHFDFTYLLTSFKTNKK